MTPPLPLGKLRGFAAVENDLGAVEEQRSLWKFEEDAAGWLWHKTGPDGTKVVSPSRFPALKECIADATRNGYIVWIPDADRRKE